MYRGTLTKCSWIVGREQAGGRGIGIREGLVADFEGGEFAGGGADVAALVADVVSEPVADGLEERVRFVAVAFDY